MANFFNKTLLFSMPRRVSKGSSITSLRQLFLDSTNINSGQQTLIPPAATLSQAGNNWIYQKNEKIRMPINQKQYIELPRNIIFPINIEDPIPDEKIIDEPPQNNDNSIEAARMIVIRRKKMKTHKLKKLRKRLKYERAKMRQRREIKKEKAFQAILIQQCKEAEAFSAEEYVQNRIEKYKEALAYVPKEANTYLK